MAEGCALPQGQMRRDLGRKVQGLWSELSLLIVEPAPGLPGSLGTLWEPPTMCVNFWLHSTNTWSPAVVLRDC